MPSHSTIQSITAHWSTLHCSSYIHQCLDQCHHTLQYYTFQCTIRQHWCTLFILYSMPGPMPSPPTILHLTGLTYSVPYDNIGVHCTRTVHLIINAYTNAITLYSSLLYLTEYCTLYTVQWSVHCTSFIRCLDQYHHPTAWFLLLSAVVYAFPCVFLYIFTTPCKNVLLLTFYLMALGVGDVQFS